MKNYLYVKNFIKITHVKKDNNSYTNPFNNHSWF